MEKDRTQLPSINMWVIEQKEIETQQPSINQRGNGIEGNKNPTTINLRKQKHKSPIKTYNCGNSEKDNDHPNLQT